MATSRWPGLGAWLGSTRNVAGCVGGLAGVALAATGLIEAPYWPPATVALYAAGALLAPTRRAANPEAVGTGTRHGTADGRQEEDLAAEKLAAEKLAAAHVLAEGFDADADAGAGAVGTAASGACWADGSPPGRAADGLEIGGLEIDGLEIDGLRAAVDARLARLTAPGSRAEPDVITAARAVAAALHGLWDDPEPPRPGGPAMAVAGRIVHHHLPGVLDSYQALPRLYATTRRLADGRTPHQVALDQLALLASAVRELAEAAARGDTAGILAQDRRLADHFPQPSVHNGTTGADDEAADGQAPGHPA